jgi:PAS domain S-box-containing protein
MHLLRDTSISRKLKVITLTTTGVALLVASAAFVAYDVIAFRQSMASDLSTLAKVMESNTTAALSFDDRDSANEVLSALVAKPNIIRARIYDKDSELFAEYVRQGVSGDLTLAVQQQSNVAFTDKFLIASEVIDLDGEKIGTVYLISDLEALRSRRNRYAGVVAAVLLGSLLVAFLLSSKLQGLISNPISHLAKTVRAVSVDKDYSIRAVKHGRDEMGMLIDGFNEMLSQIQERDARLQSARDELEQRVEERTKELQDEIAERKQAVELLRRSEEHFRSLIENASDVITIIDSTGTILYESPSVERVLGMAPQTFIGVNALDFIHPDDRKAGIALLTAALSKAGPTKPLELQFKHANGSWRTLDVMARAVREESGAVLVIINARDVTERKSRERELLFTNTILNTEHETSLDGILVVGEHQEIISFNKNFVDMWGVSDEAVRSRSDAQALQCVLDRLESPDEFLKGVTYLYDHREEKLHDELRLKGGSIFDRYSAPMNGENGQYYGRVFYFRDVTERKRSEDALRESEEKYRTILESIQEGYYEVDLKGRLTFFNDSLSRIVGTPAEKLMGLDHRQYTDPETSHRLTETFGRVFKTGESIEAVQYEITTLEGSHKLLETSVALKRNQDGQVIGFRGTIRDCTDRIRSQEALKDNEKRYRSLFETNPQAMWVYSTETLSFLAVNDAAVERYGYSREEFLAMSIKDIRPQEDVSILLQSVENAPAGFENAGAWRHRKKDGSIIDVEVSSHGLNFGGVSARLILATDITERKRALKELQDSEYKYRTLFNQIADPIVIFEKETSRFVDCNEAVHRNYGYSLDELRMMSVLDLHPPEEHSKVGQYINLKSSDLPNTYTHLTKDGGRMDVEIMTDEIDYQGRACWISIIRDITQRKRTEDKLLRLATAVEQTDDSIVITDTNGNIQYVNPAFEQTTGYSSNEVLGKTPRILRSGESTREFYKNLWKTISSGERWKGRFTNRKKDGSLFEEDATISPVRDLGGKIVNYVAVKRDVTERRKMEREVTMLAHAVRSIRDTISITDTNDDIIFVNEAFVQTYGYEREELIGRNIRQIARPPNVAANSAMPSPLHISVNRWEGELINRRKDGTEFPVQLSASPILDEAGRTIALMGVAQDITERKRAEQAIRESEMRYKTLFNAASDSIMILDTRGDRLGQIVAANLAAAEITGYTVEELQKLNLSDLRTPLQAMSVRKDIGRVLNGEKVTLEITRCRKDGTTFPVEVNQSILALGEKRYVLDFARDVTQRKESEREVAMLAQAIRSINEGVVVSDPDGNIIFVNAAVVDMLGYQSDELIGKNVTMFQSIRKPSESVGDVVMSAKANLWEGELMGRRKDGTEFPIYLSAANITDENGQCTALIGVFQDITDRKHYIEELQNAKEAAEAASLAKSEFLANMSHEIRTPMNGIVGMTELALDTELTSEQREYLKLVKLSSDSLLRVINDILDFSKIEAGKLELDRDEFSLQDNVDEVMKGLGVRADQKGLELAYYLRPGVPDRVVGDAGRLRQILVNLVGNALKFTERGEVVVRIDLESRTDDQVVLHFCVRDTGIGVPIEKQALIFDSFTQADGSTTRRYGGTGLGLAISTQLVSAMHGKIWVESPSNCGSLDTAGRAEDLKPDCDDYKPDAEKGGSGSMFHFTAAFGLAKVSQEQTAPLELSTLRGLPVLVIDDNATNRRILEVQLTGWEMKPVATESAAEALKTIRHAAAGNAPFKLALVDLHMPDIDGAELTELIRSMPEASDIKIIMMSSALRENYSKRALCVDSYLMKPVKAPELLGVIRSIFGKAALSQAESQNHRTFSSAHPARVLVAEDSPVNQELIRRLLGKWGHSVVIANNGKEAISLLAEEVFDLVLMDVQMPEMNGFEATAIVRESERATGSHIPIIALTAHALKDDRERCLEAGMDDYVSKPLDAEALFNLIETAAGRVQNAAAGRLPPASALDLVKLLRNVDGDYELLVRLIKVFEKSSPRQLTHVKEAEASGDAEALARASHLIKGSIANFGAAAAVEAAAHLERIAKSGDLSLARAVVATLEYEVNRLRQEMASIEQVSVV